MNFYKNKQKTLRFSEMLSCSPLISVSSSVSLSLPVSLALFLSLCKKNHCGLAFYLFLDIPMDFNENYRYETRPEKEKTVLHCVFVSSFQGKQGKRYPNL